LGPHFKRPPAPHEAKFHLFDYINHRLNLTADQQSKVQPITVDAETKLHALHHEELERGSAIFKTMDDQISALLTPSQQAELQKMESERDKMFSGHTHPWDPRVAGFIITGRIRMRRRLQRRINPRRQLLRQRVCRRWNRLRRRLRAELRELSQLLRLK